MESETFFKQLSEVFKQSPEKASEMAKNFVEKKFRKEKLSWNDGAKRALRGAMLYSLWKNKDVSKALIKDVCELQKLDENKRETLAKKFSKAPDYVQECFVGIVDNANTTFCGYYGILANYVDKL